MCKLRERERVRAEGSGEGRGEEGKKKGRGRGGGSECMNLPHIYTIDTKEAVASSNHQLLGTARVPLIHRFACACNY